MDIEENLTVADIMNILATQETLNFPLLVPAMLRAVARDEEVDAVEEFIRAFEQDQGASIQAYIKTTVMNEFERRNMHEKQTKVEQSTTPLFTAEQEAWIRALVNEEVNKREKQQAHERRFGAPTGYPISAAAKALKTSV